MRSVLAITLVIAAGVVVFVVWGSGPAGPERVGIEGGAALEEAATPDRLTLLTYNIHFGYGADPEPKSEAEVVANLDAIAATIVASGADIVLLQEVDFASDRSFSIDMAAYLAQKTGLGHVATATTWNVRYIPYPFWPPWGWYGRMLSGQAVLSRYPLVSQEVVGLPVPETFGSFIATFNVHHVVQVVEVRVGAVPVTVVGVHLEAFDQEVREESAIMVRDIVQGLPGSHVVVAGDFNSLPPLATSKEFVSLSGDDIDLSDDATVSTVLYGSGLVEVLGEAIYETSEKSTFTFPVGALNRRLDFIMVREGGFTVTDASVVHDALASDHLPVVATVELLP